MTITLYGAGSSPEPHRSTTGGAAGESVRSESRSEPEVAHGAIPSGVYSGADIKLVIHMPAEEGDGEHSELSILEQQLADLNARLEAGRVPISDVQEAEIEVANLQRQIQSIRDTEGEVPTTSQTKVLAEIQTLSLSIHREKVQYRPLGTTYPRAVCRGPRTISGSLVFTAFHDHVFHEFFERASHRSTGVGDWDRYRWTSYVMDQLPPLDVSAVFANEFGNISWMGIFGMDLFNEGMVMSIEDLFIEGTAQYIARDWDPMRSVANRPLTPNRGVGSELTGTSLLWSDLQERVRGRRNPWL